ncbi:MAG: hypothetical protein ACRC2T_10320, partial [Thermoguttaceae bacterium]
MFARNKLFLLLFSFAICGCSSQSGITHSALLDIVFTSHDGENGFVYFVLHNTTQHEANVTAIKITNSDTGDAVSSDLLKLTNRKIPQNGWEYGVARVGRNHAPNDLKLVVEYECAGSRLFNTAVVAPDNSYIKEIYPNENFSALIVYLSVAPNDNIHSNVDHLISHVNGKKAKIEDITALPTPSNNLLLCLKIVPADSFRQGERLFLTVSVDEMIVGGGCVKAFYPFVSSETQYGKVMRPVDLEYTNDSVKLNIYNEADFRKCPAIIERVFVDGFDVTNSTILPDAPFPPDLHNYDADVRQVVVKLQTYDKNKTQHFDIEFKRLLPLRNEKTPSVGYFDTQTFSFDAKFGIPYEIGGKNGWGIENGASVFYAGLRPRPELSKIIKRCSTISKADPGVATFACPTSGMPINVLSQVAACCDFMAIDQPFMENSQDKYETYFKYFDEVLPSIAVPWAVSVLNDNDTNPAPEDFQWLTWVAIGVGSHGVFIDTSDHCDEKLAYTCIAEVQQIRNVTRKLAPLLGVSCPIDLHIESSQNGIRTYVVQCGPDDLLVVVMNDWSSRRAFREKEKFIAAVRENVEVSIKTGENWTPICAVNPANCGCYELRHNNGTATIRLPSFNNVLPVLLKRTNAESAEFVADAFPKQPVLFQSSPVVALGTVSPNSVHDIEIPISSQVDKSVKLSAKTSEETTSAFLQIPDVLLTPHESGVLKIQFSPKNPGSKSVTSITFESEELPGFSLPVHICCDVEEPVRLSQTLVDFGMVPVNKPAIS